MDKAVQMARKALKLDESLAGPHLILGKIHYLRRQWEEAVAEMEHAASIAPTNVEVLYHYARTMVYVGRPEESIQLYRRAMRLDPKYSALVNWGLGTAYFDLERYEDACLEFERLFDRFKKGDQKLEFAHINIAATYAMLGRMEDAKRHAEKVLEIEPEFAAERFAKRQPYKNLVDKNRWADALRKAGLK